ncbi:Ankyrin repeat protein family-like protein [Rhynchospora pubera]|uniref:Ankyrin repeat protein family-like protein n=1 Tax=Rhynchospora pubera TaxID=906938 RepID=A0AAV8BQP6_9POAL|nr:Ankyrin repeat protein family-like protein [Rhynchospora pubera]
MTSSISLTNSNGNFQTFPDTVVQALVTSTTSGYNEAPTVPPLEGVEGAVMETQNSSAGDAQEQSRPRRLRIHPKLYKAAVEGDVELLKEILQSSDGHAQQLNGSSPLEGESTGGNTVLHIAASSRSDLTVQRQQNYVEFSKEVYVRNTSLLMACNKLKESPLHCAAKVGNYTMVSLLISFAEHERQVGVKKLLTARNVHGETALHEAVRVGHRGIVNKLILSEPSLMGIVDAEGISPLYLATMTNDLEIVQIHTREDPSLVSCSGPKGQTALHASVLEHTGIARDLLEWNKSLATEVDDSGNTPLHYAASVGNLGTVKLLLEHEESAAFIANKYGNFPIQIAAIWGRALVIKELIEQFPDSDELLDKHGWNILHIAIICGTGNIIGHIRHNDTFLRMLNARDYQGNTPLHLAAEEGEYQIVRFLISMNMVCTSIMNREGLTPVDLAIKKVDRGFRYLLNKQYNIIRCLMWTGALPSPRMFGDFDDDLKLPKRDEQKELQKLESGTGSLVIISALIATVTFAASFTMPGGYISDDHVSRGTPILSRKYAFKAFIVADLLAFVSSLLATSWLICAGSASVDFSVRTTHLASSVYMVTVAVQATVCAFALATYTMLYQVNLPIGILVCLLTFGLLPLYNMDYWGVLRLAPPTVARQGWKGLFKSDLRPVTRRRTFGVPGLGQMLSSLVFYGVLFNFCLYGLIFLLALI